MDIEFHGTERTIRFARDRNVAGSGVPQPSIDRVLQVNDARALLLEVGQARLELRDASFGGDSGIVGEQRSDDPNWSGPIVDVGRTPREDKGCRVSAKPCLQVAETRKDHLMDRYCARASDHPRCLRRA